jgi:hypothetical protein
MPRRTHRNRTKWSAAHENALRYATRRESAAPQQIDLEEFLAQKREAAEVPRPSPRQEKGKRS